MLKEMRMKSVWFVVLITTAAISVWYPQQLPVLLVKMNSLAVGAVAGYWLDRLTFPYARPGRRAEDGESMEIAFMYRRAILMAAGVIGVALAL